MELDIDHELNPSTNEIFSVYFYQWRVGIKWAWPQGGQWGYFEIIARDPQEAFKILFANSSEHYRIKENYYKKFGNSPICNFEDLEYQVQVSKDYNGNRIEGKECCGMYGINPYDGKTIIAREYENGFIWEE